LQYSFIMLAALDPEGPFAAVCGITWTLLSPTSGVAALLSAALCPFQRTARQAFRLSRVGLWAGSVALVDAIFMVVFDGFHKDPPEPAPDAVLTIFICLTIVAPVLSFFTGRISRRKMRQQFSANVARQKTAAAPSS
jgi:cytochrome bd-type quinol oxidase subunit 2